MVLARTPEPINPRESVSQYKAQVLGGRQGNQPMPRSVLQATTPKIPYAAKTGSGAMPSTDPNNIFGVVERGPMVSRPKPKPKPKPAPVAAKPAPVAVKPKSGSGGSYSTAKTPVGARGAYGLEAQAGSRLQALQGAYRQQFGVDLPVLSGGRTYQEQVALYNAYKAGKGNLAAKPGTSVHETGRAVDFGGPAHGYSKQQTWLAQNAPKFGWYWAGKNFSQVEPWHFEAMY